MKNLTIAFMAVAALTTVGCKKKGGAGEAMAKMGEFKDKMCACKDKKCADDVQDQMNKWSAENAKNAGDKAEAPDEKTMKEMQEVGTKYGECMAKAMGGGETPPPPPPETGSGSAGSGSAAAAPAGDMKVGEGPVIPALALVKVDLPPFKGGTEKATDKAIWSSAEAETDGNRLTNFIEGDKMWVGVQFLDCNLPSLKGYATKPEADRGIFQACFNKPTGKIKDFPMFASGENMRTVYLGHLTLTVIAAATQQGKIKGADLEEWLNSVDLAALAKL